MPKFETKEKFLFNLLGREYTDDELEQVFPRAKAELDEHDRENGVFKIELNDLSRRHSQRQSRPSLSLS